MTKDKKLGKSFSFLLHQKWKVQKILRSQQSCQEMLDKNCILVGDKPIMRYVDAAIIKFTNDGMSNIIIKARGMYISRAVDVAEITKRKLDYVKVKYVVIWSDDMKNEEGKSVRKSTIEIEITR